MKDAASITAWLSGILAFVYAFGRGAKWYFDRKDRLRAEEVKRQLLKEKDHEIASWRAHAQLTTELNTLLAKTGASRVLLMKSSNGGGIPGPGATVNVTVETEVCAQGVPLLLDWQVRRMDVHYSRMILRLIESSFVMLSAKDQPPGSMLANAYAALGVKYAWFQKVALARGAFFFLGINFTEGEAEGPDAEALELLRATAHRIRPLLAYAYEIFPYGAVRPDGSIQDEGPAGLIT